MSSNGAANPTKKAYFVSALTFITFPGSRDKLEIHENHDKMYLYRACLKAVEDCPTAKVFSHGMTFLGFTYSVEGGNGDPVKLLLKNVPVAHYSINETTVGGT